MKIQSGTPKLPAVRVQTLPNQDEEQPKSKGDDSLVDSVAEFTGDTLRTLGGTAAVALKSPSILTSSVLKSAGVEEQKADRFGTVASLLTFGTTLPLAVMGSGVVGTVAVKGLGMGEQTEGDDGAVSQFKSAYSESVQETYKDGQFLTDGLIDGVKNVSGKAEEKVSQLGRKAADKAGEALGTAWGWIAGE